MVTLKLLKEMQERKEEEQRQIKRMRCLEAQQEALAYLEKLGITREEGWLIGSGNVDGPCGESVLVAHPALKYEAYVYYSPATRDYRAGQVNSPAPATILTDVLQLLPLLTKAPPKASDLYPERPI